MKKRILTLTMALLVVSSLGFSNTITFRMNYFLPSAQYPADASGRLGDSLWKIEFDNMNFTRSNFQNTSFGLSYDVLLTQHLSIMIGLDAYSKSKSGYYKDYVGFVFEDYLWALPTPYQDRDTFSLSHTMSLSITPVQLTFKITPFGRRGKFIPYIGGGAGVYFWSARLYGQMVDFSIDYGDDPAIPIYAVEDIDLREGQQFGKVALGWHVLGGFMLPVANRLTLDIEFKYNNAKGKITEMFFERLNDPFDLSGFQMSLGLNYWF
jgi:opacity protein-like surface antigen